MLMLKREIIITGRGKCSYCGGNNCRLLIVKGRPGEVEVYSYCFECMESDLLWTKRNTLGELKYLCEIFNARLDYVLSEVEN